MGKKTKFDLKIVKELAAKGLTQTQIADYFGVSAKVVSDHKKYPEFAEALARGKSYGISNVANTVYEAAMNGDLGAAMFFLRSRGGWVDRNIQAKVAQEVVSSVLVTADEAKTINAVLENEF